MKKSVDEMQKEVDEYISRFKVGYFSPEIQMLRMTEEIGELAREVNHVYGPKQKKDSEQLKSLKEELGDVFFVLISLANSLDIQLLEAFNLTMGKFNERDSNRFERR